MQQNEVSWWYQLGLLLRRNFLNTVRLPQTSYVKLIVTIITAIFTIILFQNCDGTIQGVQNRNGALFFMTMTIAFNSIQNIILIFPDERPVFLREVNNNMYSVSAYFFGKVIAELPASILTPVIYGCIVYFSIGLSTVYAYKFPVYRKQISQVLINYSRPPDLDLQCIRQLRSHYFHPLRRQAAGGDPDPDPNHPVHAIRRVLREPGQHPHLADRVPIPVLLQIRISGTHARKK